MDVTEHEKIGYINFVLMHFDSKNDSTLSQTGYMIDIYDTNAVGISIPTTWYHNINTG